MDIDKLNMAIMNIPCKKTLSHFATVAEAKAYGLGHREARHAAVEIMLEHFKNDAEPSVAAGSQQSVLTKEQIEDIITAIKTAMNPAASFFFPRGWNILLDKLNAMLSAPITQQAVSQQAASEVATTSTDVVFLNDGKEPDWDAYAAAEATTASAGRMTEYKAQEIEREGLARTGYVLQCNDGRACIVHQGAVRWLSNQELWDVVHPDRAQAPCRETAPKIKTWRERHDAPENDKGGGIHRLNTRECMEQEITDLRAALASSAAQEGK
jgi:hypothetical protein